MAVAACARRVGQRMALMGRMRLRRVCIRSSFVCLFRLRVAAVIHMRRRMACVAAAMAPLATTETTGPM